MKLLPIALLSLMTLFSSEVSANPVKEKFTQAVSAFQNQDYARSVELFEQTLELYPNFAQVYNFMAMAKKEMGQDEEEIIALLEKAIEIDPNLTLAYDNLGKVYYGMGKFDKAKESAQKAVELNPNLVTARLSLAWISLMGFGETREAIENFEKAIEIQKTDYAIFGLGMAYFMDHQRGKVLDMITQLKLEDNTKLAQDLEDMIREGRYLPSKGVKSLLAQQEEKYNRQKQGYEKAPIPDIEYPVRLSGKLNQPQTPAQMPYAANQNMPQNDAANDRIRQLQRNYQ